MNRLTHTTILQWLRHAVLTGLATAGVACLGFLLLNWWFPFPVSVLRRQPAVVVTDHSGAPLRIFLPPD